MPLIVRAFAENQPVISIVHAIGLLLFKGTHNNYENL